VNGLFLQAKTDDYLFDPPSPPVQKEVVEQKKSSEKKTDLLTSIDLPSLPKLSLPSFGGGGGGGNDKKLPPPKQPSGWCAARR